MDIHSLAFSLDCLNSLYTLWLYMLKLLEFESELESEAESESESEFRSKLELEFEVEIESWDSECFQVNVKYPKGTYWSWLKAAIVRERERETHS